MKTLNSNRFAIPACLMAVVFTLAVSSCGRATETNANQNTVSTPIETTTPPASAPSPTPAVEIKNILFIIDSSGSMKAKAGEKTKMDEAKEVVTGLIRQLSPDIQAGLMAYGHRQKNDCKDVELLVPIGPVDKDVFGQKVQSLQPLGETPISFSIRQAADLLKAKSGKKTVILISDGEETCKEDPCVVARELKNGDIDLQIHVVGFGIDTPAAKKQLNCIAEATGGIYKDAGNAAELKKTLEGITSAAESSGAKGRLVSIIRDSNGAPLPYDIAIYKPPANEQSESLTNSLGLGLTIMKSDRVIEVPLGIYDIHYGTPALPGLWKRRVEIKPGQETRVEFEQFGRVRVSIKDQNGNAVPMYGNVFRSGEPDEQLVTINVASATQELPPGLYDIKFWNIGIEIRKNGVEIKSGLETIVEVTVNK